MFCYACILFVFLFFSSFDILSNWCSVAMGGQLDRLDCFSGSLPLCYCYCVMLS